MEELRTAVSDVGMNELIGSAYDAALDAARWPAFLARFCVVFSSDAALIFGHDFSSQTVEVTGSGAQMAAHHGFSDQAIQDFGAHYCRNNVWMADERRHQEGQVVVSAQLYPERRLLGTEWGDWMHSQGLFHSVGAIVEKRELRSFNLSGLRSKRLGPYSEAEQQRLQALIPHLQTAFAMHRRLHRAEALANASLAVLEGLPVGVVLLGEQAKVLHMNARARHLAQSTGLLHLDAGDFLHTNQAKQSLRLQRAMRLAVATGRGPAISAGDAIRLSGLDGRQLHVLVTPLPQWSSPFGMQAAGAVFVGDPSATVQSLTQSLQNLYGMTLAEARLTQALINGLSLQEYADEQQLSVHTVRSHYKSAAAKVGSGRQADFVRVVLTGPAVFQGFGGAQGLMADMRDKG